MQRALIVFAVTSLLAAPAVADEHAKARAEAQAKAKADAQARAEALAKSRAEAQEKAAKAKQGAAVPNAHLQHGHAAPAGPAPVAARTPLPAAPSPPVKQQAVPGPVVRAAKTSAATSSEGAAPTSTPTDTAAPAAGAQPNPLSDLLGGLQAPVARLTGTAPTAAGASAKSAAATAGAASPPSGPSNPTSQLGLPATVAGTPIGRQTGTAPIAAAAGAPDLPAIPESVRAGPKPLSLPAGPPRPTNVVIWNEGRCDPASNTLSFKVTWDPAIYNGQPWVRYQVAGTGCGAPAVVGCCEAWVAKCPAGTHYAIVRADYTDVQPYVQSAVVQSRTYATLRGACQ